MKNIKTHLVLLLAVLLCLPILTAAQEDNEGENEEPKCPSYVTDIKGEVEFTEDVETEEETDEQEWEPLEVDTCVYPEYLIRTGPESSAAMILGGDALIRVNENSNFKLANEDEEAEVPNQVDMDLGELLTTLVPDEEDEVIPFTINTPSGVVAVKGTEFHVAVDEEGKSEVKVLEGVVEVFNELGKVMAEAGMATELLEGIIPSEPFKFDMEKFNEYLGWANALSTGDIKKFIKEKVQEEVKEEVKKKTIKKIGGGLF